MPTDSGRAASVPRECTSPSLPGSEQLFTAVLAALICSTALLCVAGWAVGRDGRLSTGERVVSAAVAGMFGVFFIALKTLLH